MSTRQIIVTTHKIRQSQTMTGVQPVLSWSDLSERCCLTCPDMTYLQFISFARPAYQQSNLYQRSIQNPVKYRRWNFLQNS